MSATLHLSGEALRDVAQANGVCVRPVVHEVYDSETGAQHLVRDTVWVDAGEPV